MFEGVLEFNLFIITTMSSICNGKNNLALGAYTLPEFTVIK